MAVTKNNPSASESSFSRRRWSREHPPSFGLKHSKDYKLYEAITEFLKLGEDKREQLVHNISELQTVLHQRGDLENRTSTKGIYAAVTSATGILLTGLAALMTGGLNLVILGLGVIASIIGAALNIRSNSTYKIEGEKTRLKWQAEEAEFKRTVNQLKKDLNNVKKICEKQRQEEKDENTTGHLPDLELQVQKFKGQTSSLEMLCDIRQASIDQMQTTLSEFDNIRTVFERILRRLNDKHPDQASN